MSAHAVVSNGGDFHGVLNGIEDTLKLQYNIEHITIQLETESREEKEFKDFIIETEVRWSGEIDSGIMLRKPELQLQFGVSRSLKKDMSCSFYTGGKEGYPPAGQAHDIDKLWKADDWNKVRMQARGDTFTVWLNGKQV